MRKAMVGKGKRKIEAIGYMRTSSATNVGRDKDSEARQRAAIESYAKASGYIIVDWFYDPAVKGSDAVKCVREISTPVSKIVISAHAEYATNKVSGPTSNGGAEPKSPRHILMVRTCWRFPSSTCTTMQSTFGKSPEVS
jgi:hypothetical protein